MLTFSISDLILFGICLLLRFSPDTGTSCPASVNSPLTIETHNSIRGALSAEGVPKVDDMRRRLLDAIGFEVPSDADVEGIAIIGSNSSVHGDIGDPFAGRCFTASSSFKADLHPVLSHIGDKRRHPVIIVVGHQAVDNGWHSGKRLLEEDIGSRYRR